MDYKGLPADLVANLRAESFQAYLMATGWMKLETFKEEIAVYRHPDSKLNEIIIPLDTEFADYNERMADAVVGIAEFENRAAQEVLDELLLPADNVCFRLEDSVIQNGTIPLELALNLLNAGQTALQAVLKVYLGDETPDRLGEYFMFMSQFDPLGISGNCRFEVGRESFSTYFIYPLGGYFAHIQSKTGMLIAALGKAMGVIAGQHAITPNMFARRTLKSLMLSTETIVKALTENDIDKLIYLQGGLVNTNEAEERRDISESRLCISPELCNALLDMQPRSAEGSLSLRATWAKIAPSSSGSYDEVRIPQHLFARIEELSRELAQKDERKSSYYVGKIYQIGNNDKGEVFLTLLDNSQSGLIKARVELNPIDFDKASHAYRESYNIGILGELERDRPVNHIRDYKLFQVLVPITMGEGSLSFPRF